MSLIVSNKVKSAVQNLVISFFLRSRLSEIDCHCLLLSLLSAFLGPFLDQGKEGFLASFSLSVLVKEGTREEGAIVEGRRLLGRPSCG